MMKATNKTDQIETELDAIIRRVDAICRPSSPPPGESDLAWDAWIEALPATVSALRELDVAANKGCWAPRVQRWNRIAVLLAHGLTPDHIRKLGV